MTCVQEIQNAESQALFLLILQYTIVIVYFVRRKQKRNNDIFFLLGLCFLHPRILKTSVDCGSELTHGSLLFLMTTIGLVFWMYYRDAVMKKTKDS